MKVKIQIKITKKTAEKPDYAEFIKNFTGEFREGESYAYLDFGPFNLMLSDIKKLEELFDFLGGPAIRSISFIDIRKDV